LRGSAWPPPRPSVRTVKLYRDPRWL
jgi:hypothetical protein